MDSADAYEPSIPRLQLNLCIWLPQRPECVSLPWEIPAHVDLASNDLPLYLTHHVSDALVRVDSAAAGLVIIRVWYYKHREISADAECCIYDASGGRTVSGLEDFLSCVEDGSRSGGAVADLHLEMGYDPGRHAIPAPMATESLPDGLVKQCRTFTDYPVCQLFELFSLQASDRASIVAEIGQKRTVTGSDMAQLLVAMAQRALQATLRRQRLYKAHRYVTAVTAQLLWDHPIVPCVLGHLHAQSDRMLHQARPAARSRARAEARLFLQLIVVQQRENMDELRAAYQHLCENETPESYQDASVHASGSKSQTVLSIPGVGLLLEHAELALDSLTLHQAVRDRVKTLLHAQLSSEVSYDAEIEGGEIAVKELLEVDLVVQNLEKMLCDGLAKPCDLVAALHVRVFDAINKESLREKITNRLGGTTLGVLVTQRLELLEHTYLQDGELCARANSRGRNGKPRSVMEDLDRLIGLLPERSSRLEDERSMKKIKAARLPPSDPLVQELNAKFAEIPVPALVPGAAHPPAELNKHQLATWLGALPAIAELAYGSQRSVKLCDVRYVVMEMVELGAKQSRRSWKNSAPSVTYMAMIMTVIKLAWVAQRRMTGRGDAGATATAAVDVDPVLEPGVASEQTRRAVGEEIVKLDNEALMLQKHAEVSSADVKQMKRGLRALLELLRRAAEKVDGIDAGLFLQKVRLRVSEALTQAADIHEASLLIEDGNLGDVLAEAVGDVPVEEVQLTKLIYALTYRTTVDSVIKKCSRGAAREWLQVLMLRKPMIHKAEDTPHTKDPLAAAWLETAASALDKAYKWATAVARVLDESFDAENRLIHLMTRATTDGLRVYQDRLNAMHDAINGVAKGDNLSLSGHTDGLIEDEAICALKTVGGAHDVMGICSVCSLDGRSTQRSDSTAECRGCAARKSVFLVRQRGAERLLLQHLVERSVAGVVRDTLQGKLSDATVADDDEPLDLASAWRLPGRSPPTSTGVASLRSRRYPLSLRFAEGEEFIGGHGLVGSFGRASRGLLDAGQRLSPDGSEYNVIRLHRLMALQSAEADEQVHLVIQLVAASILSVIS
ncbi:hypothetical protein AB1Y20_009937 [Prymnesium parvum]|uniref:Uncharacterized protein n=1 Tax=Prymnesium parvum TaxID=97485 RepID=A0AB34K5T5_PRYPA